MLGKIPITREVTEAHRSKGTLAKITLHDS